MSGNAKVSFRGLTAKDTTNLLLRVCKNPDMIKELTKIGIEKGKVVANDDCKKGQFGFIENGDKIKFYEAQSPRASNKRKKEKITNDNYGAKKIKLQNLEELNNKYQDDNQVKECIADQCFVLRKELNTYEKKLAKQSSKKKVVDTFDSTLTGLSSPKQSKTAKPASTSEMKDCDQTSTMPPMNPTMDTTGDIKEILMIKTELELDNDNNRSSSEDDSE